MIMNSIYCHQFDEYFAYFWLNLPLVVLLLAVQSYVALEIFSVHICGCHRCQNMTTALFIYLLLSNHLMTRLT